MLIIVDFTDRPPYAGQRTPTGQRSPGPGAVTPDCLLRATLSGQNLCCGWHTCQPAKTSHRDLEPGAVP